jgi:hypothetical protein
VSIHYKEVTGLQNTLCGVQKYASASFLEFLELAENCTRMDRKMISVVAKPWMGTINNERAKGCALHRLKRSDPEEAGRLTKKRTNADDAGLQRFGGSF